MTESTLNNRRRLERHSRRDGNLQSRARPVALQGDDDSDASYIRRMVEKAQNVEGGVLRRLLGNSGNDTPTDGTDSGGGTSTNPSSGNGSSGSGNTSPNPANTTPSTRPTTTRNPSTPTSTRNTSTTTSSTSTSTTSSSTSSTERTTRTTSSSSSSSSSSLSTSRTPTSSLGPTTTVAYVTSSATTSNNVALSSSTSTGKASSGVGAGPIIGIVAGALAGVAVLVVIVGFLIKKFSRKEDPYESDPFDRDDFTRHSAMLPETFESEDGHPSMAEYGNNMHSVGGYGSEAGYAGAGAAGFAGGIAASSSFNAHNEGGPRPPSMFQKHINGPGAQYNMADAPPAPQIGAIYGARDPTPQIPPMAFGGSDPYSTAGVGRNHQLDGNISNPYAHLDRSMSGGYAAQPNQYESRSMYTDLDRNGSQGSSYPQNSIEKYHSGEEMESAGHGFDTAGRPGTSEGRSGTPDLPNVQQTYALGAGPESELHHQYEREQRLPPQNLNNYNSAGQSLQVRNLLPNSYDQQQQHHHQQQQYYAQRPLSNVSSQPGDDDAAYGGVW